MARLETPLVTTNICGLSVVLELMLHKITRRMSVFFTGSLVARLLQLQVLLLHTINCNLRWKLQRKSVFFSLYLSGSQRQYDIAMNGCRGRAAKLQCSVSDRSRVSVVWCICTDVCADRDGWDGRMHPGYTITHTNASLPPAFELLIALIIADLHC